MGRLSGFRYREITTRLRKLGFEFDRHARGSRDRRPMGGLAVSQKPARNGRGYFDCLGEIREATHRQLSASCPIIFAWMRREIWGSLEVPWAICADVAARRKPTVRLAERSIAEDLRAGYCRQKGQGNTDLTRHTEPPLPAPC